MSSSYLHTQLTLITRMPLSLVVQLLTVHLQLNYKIVAVEMFPQINQFLVFVDRVLS